MDFSPQRMVVKERIMHLKRRKMPRLIDFVDTEGYSTVACEIRGMPHGVYNGILLRFVKFYSHRYGQNKFVKALKSQDAEKKLHFFKK